MLLKQKIVAIQQTVLLMTFVFVLLKQSVVDIQQIMLLIKFAFVLLKQSVVNIQQTVLLMAFSFVGFTFRFLDFINKCGVVYVCYFRF